MGTLVAAVAARRGFRAASIAPPSNPDAAIPTGRLFVNASGQTVDLYPGIAAGRIPTVQPEYFDTTLPGNGGANPTNAQFLAYLATLPSWSAPAVTTAAEFNAAVAAIDAAGPAEGVIKVANSYASTGGYIVIDPRPLPNGVQPDWRTCTIYVIPETLPGTFPEPGETSGAWKLPGLKTQLPEIQSRGGVTHGWHAIDGETSGLGVYGFRFVGIRFSNHPTTPTNYARVIAGRYSRGIITDRCYFESAGPDRKEGGNGMYLNGRYVAALDSWYDEFWDHWSERQCILTITGGPIKIVGNVMLGNGEVYMSGGTDNPVGTGLETYPRDLEFRQNFCRQDFGSDPRHPDWGPSAHVLYGGGGTPLLAQSYDAATNTLTLSQGTFDTSLTSRPNIYLSSEIDYRHHRFWYVASGAGSGSWGEIDAYPTATSATVNTARTIPVGSTGRNVAPLFLTGAAIDTTSVIEIRMRKRAVSKNCFELKNMRRALVEGCILENGWDMDGSQYFIANLKTAHQGHRNADGTFSGNAPLTRSENVAILNTAALNCWGGFGLAQDGGDNAVYGLPARRFYFENVLVRGILPAKRTTYLVTSGSELSNRSTPWSITTDDTELVGCASMDFRRVLLLSASRPHPAEDEPATHTGYTDNFAVRRTLFDYGVQGLATDEQWREDGAAGRGTLTASFGNEVIRSATGLPPSTPAQHLTAWEDVAVYRAPLAPSSMGSYFPNNGSPKAGLNTSITQDTAPYVNPLDDPRDPAADYSTRADLFTDLAQRPGLSDWPTLHTIFQTVRPPASQVPYQW